MPLGSTGKHGQDGGIRTHILLNPNQARLRFLFTLVLLGDGAERPTVILSTTVLTALPLRTKDAPLPGLPKSPLDGTGGEGGS